jgi:hypothetical protein
MTLKRLSPDAAGIGALKNGMLNQARRPVSFPNRAKPVSMQGSLRRNFGGRPVIRLEPGNHYEIAERVTALLVAAGRVYRRDRHLIYTYDQTFSNDPKVYVQLERLRIIKLRLLIGDVARFEEYSESTGGYLPIEPPKSVASIIIRNVDAFPEYEAGGSRDGR